MFYNKPGLAYLLSNLADGLYIHVNQITNTGRRYGYIAVAGFQALSFEKFMEYLSKCFRIFTHLQDFLSCRTGVLVDRQIQIEVGVPETVAHLTEDLEIFDTFLKSKAATNVHIGI